MAHRKMILTDAGAAIYRNRMLTAGSPVTLSAGDARLFAKHGWATAKAKRAAKAPEPAAPIIPTADEVLAAEVVAEAPKPARKPRGRKRSQ
jgi:hypothetical protein